MKSESQISEIELKWLESKWFLGLLYCVDIFGVIALILSLWLGLTHFFGKTKSPNGNGCV